MFHNCLSQRMAQRIEEDTDEISRLHDKISDLEEVRKHMQVRTNPGI